jgi:pSer/pThr/pTyr-binding forkhead associated (FHA) protein
MARLLWEHEGQVIKDYPFPKGSVTIGRRKDNTIAFTNPEVSSSHARIDKVGTDYILTDLQSTNGTFVNNLKVYSHRLSHGDRITIGKNVLLFIGTEIAKAEAERAKIPLDRTVIISPSKQRKKAPARPVPIERPYIEPTPARNYLWVYAVGVLIIGALAVVGVFTVMDDASLLSGILPKVLQGQRTEGKTAQEGDISSSADSEATESPAVTEMDSGAGDSERSPFDIEAIVWSSDAKNSFVLINGVEYRVGEAIGGKTIARIERDHVVTQSQEGESIIRLKFK